MAIIEKPEPADFRSPTDYFTRTERAIEAQKGRLEMSTVIPAPTVIDASSAIAVWFKRQYGPTSAEGTYRIDGAGIDKADAGAAIAEAVYEAAVGLDNGDSLEAVEIVNAESVLLPWEEHSGVFIRKSAFEGVASFCFRVGTTGDDEADRHLKVMMDARLRAQGWRLL